MRRWVSKWAIGGDTSRATAAHMIGRYLPGPTNGPLETSVRRVRLEGSPGTMRVTCRKDSPARLHPEAGSGGTTAPQCQPDAGAWEAARRKVWEYLTAWRRRPFTPPTDSAKACTRRELEPARASTISPPSRSPPGGVYFAPTAETRPTAQCDADDSPQGSNELGSSEPSLHGRWQSKHVTTKNLPLQGQKSETRPQSRRARLGRLLRGRKSAYCNYLPYLL